MINSNTFPKKPILIIWGVYLLCFLFRAIEYMFIRTDRSLIGEAFIHKTLGIIILAVVIRTLFLKWEDIGFQKKVAVRHTIWGLMLGVCTFAVAYGTEFIIQQVSGNSPELSFYISSYSLNGNNIMQTNIIFFIVCIIGNIINVIMEEGVFRGLFLRLAEKKYSFLKAMLFSSLLFGVWHIAAPMRELLDGNMNTASAIIAVLMQVFLTGLGGIMFCMLVKITGSLWTSIAAHFVNNFIINVLHIITISGADELQVIRISVAQTLSFVIVLLIYWKKKASQQDTFLNNAYFN